MTHAPSNSTTQLPKNNHVESDQIGVHQVGIHEHHHSQTGQGDSTSAFLPLPSASTVLVSIPDRVRALAYAVEIAADALR